MTYPRAQVVADMLAGMDDLEEAKRALIREATIRQVMAETGEDRRTVTDMMDAMGSMGQEAVLELTEGEPTTLADALQRYVDTLEQAAAAEDETLKAGDVCGALTALLAYPWPDSPVPAASGTEPGACPICHSPGGFHEDEAHRRTREAIPAHLKRPSNTAARREQRAAGGPLRS